MFLTKENRRKNIIIDIDIIQNKIFIFKWVYLFKFT
jgi:hypothetical protein